MWVGHTPPYPWRDGAAGVANRDFRESAGSPHLTFIDRVHVATQRTPEIVTKVFQVGERAYDSELAGRMETRGDAVLERLGPILGAPHVSGADPEHLLRRVVLEPGKTGFDPVTFRPHVVRVIRLLDATVVRYIFALGVNAV